MAARETRSRMAIRMQKQNLTPDDMIRILLAAPTDGSRDTLDVTTAAKFLMRPENAVHLIELLFRGLGKSKQLRSLSDRMLLRFDVVQLAQFVSAVPDYYMWKLLALELNVPLTGVLLHLDDATTALILPGMLSDIGIDAVRADLDGQILSPLQTNILVKYDIQMDRRRQSHGRLSWYLHRIGLPHM